MIKTIGWFSSLLLALCGAPQAYQSYVQGHSNGVSLIFIVMWLFGEIGCLIYVYYQHRSAKPLLLNYGLNIFFISVILYYCLLH